MARRRPSRLPDGRAVSSDGGLLGGGRLARLLPVLAVAWCCGGCGDAYSSHLPTQRTEVPLVLSPDNLRVGAVYVVDAIAFTPASGSYISAYDFGDGLDVLDFDTGAGSGCAAVDTSNVTVPDLFETTYVFPVCLTLQARDGASLGERQVELDIESDGQPLVARTAFYVLPALSE